MDGANGSEEMARCGNCEVIVRIAFFSSGDAVMTGGKKKKNVESLRENRLEENESAARAPRAHMSVTCLDAGKGLFWLSLQILWFFSLHQHLSSSSSWQRCCQMQAETLAISCM